MKSYDAIIVGAGIIGLSLAIELRNLGMSVLVVEKGEPGREASWAAGGMLAASEVSAPLLPLAAASARMYSEFVHELEDESGRKIDLRADGTLLIRDAHDQGRETSPGDSAPTLLSPTELAALEPQLASQCVPVQFLQERCVDPRNLLSASIAAARHRGIELSSGDRVLAIEVVAGRACGVRTDKTQFAAVAVINCAGAWAGQIGCVETGSKRLRAEREPAAFLPTRPVKGQMLCVAMPEKTLLRHVVRTSETYLIPRSDGRLLIGTTQEEAGFDKQTIPDTLQKLRKAALHLIPRLAEARILEAWAGLRPGTPDNLPVLGETGTPGYYVATGHFRDGILLAPITAKIISQLIAHQTPDVELSAFSANRFCT